MINKITNHCKYNESMKLSLNDKLFFVDKIDTDIIIDYGCADGAMLKVLSDLNPSVTCIGYDIDADMLKLANKNCDGKILFTNNWQLIEDATKNKVSTIILNSVIHEVYSYCSQTDIDIFWDRVYSFDYVVMRDMIPSEAINRPSNLDNVSKILQYSDKYFIDSFRNTWGEISNNKNLHHYLLKYRYKNNWNREVKENYLPLTKEKLLKLMPKDYKITFCEHYILPFLKDVVKKDYDITIKDNTHLKLIAVM